MNKININSVLPSRILLTVNLVRVTIIPKAKGKKFCHFVFFKISRKGLTWDLIKI